MDRLLEFISSPLGYMVVIAIFGFVLRRIRGKYIKLLNIFIETIERVDKEVHDIVPEEFEKKLTKAKTMIARQVNKEEKALIDKLKPPIEKKVNFVKK